MPASPRTLFWLNTNDANEPFGVASSWTTTEGSSTPAATPPTSIDDTEIDTTATVSGSGSASVLNINAGVTVSGSLNTDVTNTDHHRQQRGGQRHDRRRVILDLVA